MDIRSPVAEGEDHLTALPAELLADIVELLPVREICRLRSLSCHFRDFVDTNQGLLTQDHISYHQARIHGEYKLLTDLSDCDIVDALRRYDSHYDFVGHSPYTSAVRNSEAVSPTFNYNWMKAHHHAAAGTHRASVEWMRIYFLMSVAEHIKQHAQVQRMAVDMCLRDHVWSPGFRNAEAFIAKLTQVTSTRVDVAHVVMPSNFITRRKLDTKYMGSSQTRERLGNPQEETELEQLLGLPDLDPTDGWLAYCSSSGKTASLVREMEQGRSARLKQAAIIEEIFIW